MYNFGSFDAFIVKPTIMPDFARNLLHYIICFPIVLFKVVFKLLILLLQVSYCRIQTALPVN